MNKNNNRNINRSRGKNKSMKIFTIKHDESTKKVNRWNNSKEGERERENQIEAANYCKNFSTDCVNIYKYTENDKKMLLYIEEVIFLLKLIEIRSKKFFIIHFHFYTCQIRIWLMVSYCLRHSFFWYTHKHTHTPKKESQTLSII